MSVLINTGELPSAGRWRAWCHIICDTLGPLDARKVDQDAPLWGRIEAGTLGAARVAKVTASTAHTVHRTAGLIRRDSPELYRVALALNGRHVVAQAALSLPRDQVDGLTAVAIDGRQPTARLGRICVADHSVR